MENTSQKTFATLNKIEGIRYQVTPMGTMIEADSIDKVFEASKSMANAVFEMRVERVETILKID